MREAMSWNASGRPPSDRGTAPRRPARSCCTGSADDHGDDLGDPGGDVVQAPGEHPDPRPVAVDLDPDAVELDVHRRRQAGLLQGARPRPARWPPASAAPGRPTCRPTAASASSAAGGQDPRGRRRWSRAASPPAAPPRPEPRTPRPDRPAPARPARPAGPRRRPVRAGTAAPPPWRGRTAPPPPWRGSRPNRPGQRGDLVERRVDVLHGQRRFRGGLRDGVSARPSRRRCGVAAGCRTGRSPPARSRRGRPRRSWSR